MLSCIVQVASILFLPFFNTLYILQQQLRMIKPCQQLRGSNHRPDGYEASDFNEQQAMRLLYRYVSACEHEGLNEAEDKQMNGVEKVEHILKVKGTAFTVIFAKQDESCNADKLEDT